MDSWFNFTLHQKSSEADVLEELSSCNLQNICFLQDLESGETTLCATADDSLFSKNWKHITSYTKIENPDINWSQEWDTFSPYFQNGLARIPLSDFAPASKEELTLLPGPGFGDLSHPTTTLSLTLLAKYAAEKTLIDLGCGSGILSLAALKWNAHFVYSLDIDQDALNHTQKNALYNHFEDRIYISSALPSNLAPPPSLLVMNMTFGDQKEALKSLSFIPNLWIISGILKKQKETYFKWAEKKGFKVLEVLTQDQWIACVMLKKQI